MLGEQFAEERGKIIGNRVLSVDNPGPKVEASFQDAGKMFGIEMTNWGTYSSVPRLGGGLYGEGQGVVMTRDGEMATWTGQGVGRFTGHGGAVSYRGSLYFQTASKKLERLNGIVGVYEFEVDENGNTHGKIWEWK